MPRDETRETPTRAQIGKLVDEYAEAMLSLADAQHGKAPIPPARLAADAAFAKLDTALAALTAEHEASARDAEDAERAPR